MDTKDIWIQTFTGGRFHPFNPVEKEVSLVDIANSLSNTCRFRGHCSLFYSVAQHSIFVSQVINPEYVIEGLLHDAAEAYLCDLSTPIKDAFPLFKEVEERILFVIADYFGFMFTDKAFAAIKEADEIALAAEVKAIFPAADVGSWNLRETHERYALLPALSPDQAYIEFLARATKLGLVVC